MRTPKNRLQELAQTLQSRQAQPSSPKQKKRHQTKPKATVEAMAYDHSEPIELRYNQETDSYAAKAPTYTAAQSVEPELNFGSEAFEVEPFEAKPVAAAQSIPLQPEVVADQSQPMPVKPAAPSVQSFSSETVVEPEPSTDPDVATNDDFLEDLQAILKGEKTYEGTGQQVGDAAPNATQLSTSEPSAPGKPAKQGSPHDVFDRLEQGLPPDPEPTPAPTYSNAHSVFDRMGNNMAFANSFDLGTVSLQQKFDEFDQTLDDEERNLSKSRISEADNEAVLNLDNQLNLSSTKATKSTQVDTKPTAVVMPRSNTIQPVSTQVDTKPTAVTMPGSDHQTLMTAEELRRQGGEVYWYNINSTYRRVLQKLEDYERFLSKNSDSHPFKKISFLFPISAEITTWLDKNSKNESKKSRKEALENLQIQVNREIKNLVPAQNINEVLPGKLAEILFEISDFSKTSSVILFSQLMEKLISIYGPNGITNENFKVELRNLLIANNDVVGSSSFALQTSGNSGEVKVNVDVGKLLFPCFKANVGVEVGAKSVASRLIVSECQSPDAENDYLKRYCLMDLNGYYSEGTFGVNLEVGIEASAGLGTSIRLDPGGSNVVDRLEVASLSFDTRLAANVGAEATASVGGGVEGIWLKVSAQTPVHFNEVSEVEDRLFKLITSKNDKNGRFNSQDEVYFSLFSHAYNAEAGVKLGASAKVAAGISISTEAEAKAQVQGSCKISSYTYQTKLSNQTFKTQRTQMYFKQVGAELEATALAKANLLKESENEAEMDLLKEDKSIRFVNKKTEKGVQARKGYMFVNSLSYHSAVAYWRSPSDDNENAHLLPGSGFCVGHSIILKTLRDKLYGDSIDENYIAELAKALKLNSLSQEEALKYFLFELRSIVQGMTTEPNREDRERPFIETRTFIEATFISRDPVALKLQDNISGSDRLSQNYTLDSETMRNLSDTNNHILQSLRFRSTVEGKKQKYDSIFKLGFNVKIGNELGAGASKLPIGVDIDLGRIEDASSLKLTDLVIEWYGIDLHSGNSVPLTKAPKVYVPSSSLIM
ncbi:hypothetical protein [Nodosilinea sp. P-1105]|uniref:hypothetical protein n=1 Tax=Nodosilinea sp. P-1105 TaxID=2546229 RepID=UPI00146E88C4|nr:hypothetical protein [Nodosilinea sp. P-1105]NMF86708.1 hypothetical protein [Nodosilinea sp. P-1105]